MWKRPSWLASDWTIVLKTRENGATAGLIDPMLKVQLVYCMSMGLCIALRMEVAGSGSATPVFSHATVQVVCTPDVIVYAPNNVTTNSNGVYLVVVFPSQNASVDSVVFERHPALPSVGLVSSLQLVRKVCVLFWSISFAGFTLQVYL